MAAENQDEQLTAKNTRLSRGEFARRFALAMLIAILILGLALFVAFSIQMWFAVYVGILLAIFIRTLSDWVSRHTPLPDKLSVLLVLVALVGLVALAGWWLVKPLTRESAQLQQRLPQMIDQFQQQIHGTFLDRFVPDHFPNGSQISANSEQIASKVMSIFSGTLQSLVTVLVILFLGIYLSFSPDQYVNGLIELVPKAKRDRAREVLDEASGKLRHWIFGQIVSMTAVGVMVALGSYFAGIPLPLVIGFLAGVLDIIPIFGPVVAAVPAILLGLTVSPLHALYAVLVFVAANQIEQHLLIPVVQRYSVSLPPALTIVALLVMGSLFGFWGMLLAAPLTATAMVLIQRIYVGDVLDDNSEKNEARR